MKMKKYFYCLLTAILVAIVSFNLVSCGGSDEDDLPEGWTKASGIRIVYNINHKQYVEDTPFNGYIYNLKLYSLPSEDLTPLGDVSLNTRTQEGTYDVSGYSLYTRFTTNGGTHYWLYYYNEQ